ncbi:Ku protein [Streptomyces gardneri]|uniref:non-homologous end joining protein Ku n=1 Tax=Nocardia TaxID=1817 RepID=UPI00135AA4CD|nr:MULTISPECIES: Ku protein [Nocardia]MBF6167588.1 Ku protein [Streptomyces gardneri]MBF6206363.1 Ku protein [Streptomyces gardneri]UAK30349.1 Ku protein [Nocardia asteroides]
MRSIWKGSIAFGLVNVPVKVYTATEDHDIRFHQVHAKDGGRIKYERVCTVCGQSVQYTDIDKAYESPDGDKVVLSDEDFAKLPVAEKHEIPVLQFVPSEQIDPVLFEKSYYLEPDSSTPKAYVLLARTLEEIERTALVYFTLRQKTRLAALRVRDGILVLQTLLWPDEVRSVEFESLDGVAEPRPQEIKMAETLVEAMSDDFDPDQFTDEYQIELKRLLDEAIASGTGKVPEQPELVPSGMDAEVVDLVAALQRSLEASGRRTAGGDGGEEPKKAAKKATAKSGAGKSAASKSTASKSTATKGTASKSTAAKSAAKKAPAKKAAKKAPARKGA